MVQNPNLIMGIFVLLVLSGVYLQRRVEFIRKLSAAMYCIFGAMILANIGIIPTWSEAHNVIFSYVVPFSIALVLFNAKVSDLKFAAVPALKAFLIHCVTAVVGFGLSAFIFKGLIGPNAWQAAAVFIAGGIGGTVNNIATGSALAIDKSFFGPILTAAMVGFTIYLFFIFALPSFLPKWGFKSAYKTLDKDEAKKFYESYWNEKSINLDGVTTILSVAIILTVASIFLKQTVFNIPVEIYTTTFALILANTTNIGSIGGSEEIGTFGFLLFFAACGGMVNIAELIKTAPILLVMYLLALLILSVIGFFVCKLLGINYEAILIAGNAGVGGPTTAPVMAVSFGWKELVLTGIVLGIFGYAIGTYIGLAGGYIIKAIFF
ncbi:DUF819 family protein [Thermoanaerobacteraceae bacterium SP2]|jgi:uncharacterized membrane protein|nr:DUF819 family protein [Thermoanaerobacteraceae bacterium SP2]